MDEQELQHILEEGEGQEIEFKESLANLDKELVAFANSSGGRILVDITDEEKIRFDDLRNSQFVYDEHFDSKKLDRFLRLAGISKVMDDQSILLNLGAAERLEDGRIIAAAHERGRTAAAGVHLHELLHGYVQEGCCGE